MKWLYIVAIPIILITAFESAKSPEPLAQENLPAIPDTSGPVAEPSIRTVPNSVTQGEPVRIIVENIGTFTVESLLIDGKRVDTFIYNGIPSAIVGIDLNARTGPYPIKLSLSNGTSLSHELTVNKRPKVEAPLGIPDNLGGNTPEAEQELLRTLAEENRILNTIPTEKRVLWQGEFVYPVRNPIVTDEYGYSRLTGASTISHKGTDYRAPIGTEVFAMNSGIVRIAREFRNYGYTVVIDHGFGIQTMYMHLSELLVKPGDSVEKGALIAKSGKTGYSEFPHLHITVKVGGISIDPEKFLKLF